MILEVRHLRMVEAISREGTVSAAARRLNLTQSAVSHALRDLEDRLDLSLFQRGKGKMRPTVHGRRVLKLAGPVLEQIRQAEQDLLRSSKISGEGILRLCTQCYTCYAWLPAVMQDFMEDVPGYELRIVPEATDGAIEALLNEEVDLAIVHQPVGRNDICEIPLFRDEILAVVPKGDPLGEKEFLTAQDFADRHLILHSDPEGSLIFRKMLTPAGVQPRQVSQLRLTEAVVEAVRAGLGITVLAGWVLSPKLEGGHLRAIRLGRGGIYRTWSAAVLRSRRDDLPLTHLTDLLRRKVAHSGAELEPAEPATA
ncbi:MAG TPA: LysR family transcriptional regulator [Acidobacteriota bacterium]|nr:LysR family transcriptional regulator [Acidobacteriota bacterium]